MRPRGTALLAERFRRRVFAVIGLFVRLAPRNAHHLHKRCR